MSIFRTLLLCLFLLPVVAGAEVNETPEPEKDAEWAQNLWQSMERHNGQIKLEKAQATLNISNDFYFLDAVDAEKVLVDVWSNPPGKPVLGMIIPSSKTPFDKDMWAVTIQYDEDGYVSDQDAADMDYTELLKSMQKDTEESNAERIKQGYDPIKLIGWAASPFYDKQQHKIHWAKEIQFGNDPLHTLNYNIRILGRKGVLILNFIADIEQLPAIEGQLPAVLAMAEFDKGSSYEEFDPELDKVAAYGLGALVAGKVLAKTGLIAALLIFLKKFGVFIVVGFGALLRKFLGKNKAL